MKLIGLFDSPYVRRVAVSMRLYDMPFEHIALSVFRHQDEMRKINPLLKVPLLVLDSGERLMESSFILDYLEGEAAPEKRLTPAFGESRRHVQQQCAMALLAAEKTLQSVYESTMRPAEFSYAPWLERCIGQMHAAFGMLEALPPSSALAGEPLTQGDVTTAIVLRFAQYMLASEFPVGRYSQLEKLSAYCESLPAFIQTPLE
ncbi:MAG TPA: glutathione S-transferase [Noviherbaspirillum sp.]|nr:glutathione S-transferase [Noviherbaspirillum sp.]